MLFELLLLLTNNNDDIQNKINGTFLQFVCTVFQFVVILMELFFLGNDDIFFHSSSEVRGYPLLEDTTHSIRIATLILLKKTHDDASDELTNFILMMIP